MSELTHGYLPVAVDDKIGFVRTALADMTEAELRYIEETRGIGIIAVSRIERNEKWAAAYEKLKAAQK